ncbi:MAG: Kef-type K+ transport system, predicted NAD-binding component [Microgenomates group bacterium GW2011_GWF2_47_9]|nr:MAG: Kef-type K+ transport system, predicted NAD-binding component [Microgenomates group bacterium GW2011_GWF2_47_9]
MSGEIRQVAKKLSTSHRLRRIVAVLVFVVVGLGILSAYFEKGSSLRTVENGWDGVYFAITTVTGVGYGDMVPTTLGGRMVAMILQIVGVVLFGSVVAMVSVEILRYQEDYYVRRMFRRMDELEVKLDEIKKHLDYLVKK